MDKKINTAKLTFNLVLLPLALGSLTYSHTTEAGGYQLSDHSVTSLGRSHSGYGVVGDDASAVQFNPAGMSLIKQAQAQLGGSYNIADFRFSDTGSTGANTGTEFDGDNSALVPNFYWVRPLNERMHIGLGITSPFGTNTDYDDNFFGRFNGLKTELKTANINPSVSYKLNDTVAIGFGLSYQTLEATISSAISPRLPGSLLEIDGDSGEFAYNFGMMFSFADESRLGISYRSKAAHDIEGSATFTNAGANSGTFDATSQFTTPETVYVGYTKPVNDWRFSLGYRWTRWSRFQNFLATFPTATLTQSAQFDSFWNDSYSLGVGVDYQLSPKWVIRAGYLDDQTPTIDATRSVRTVDADRSWYSIGATYHQSSQIQLDFAYRYIEIDDGPVNRPTGPNGSLGSVIGEFNEISVNTFAMQLNYKY